jgi:hypothetical protein
MGTYRVVWEIDVEAESAEDAARQALEIQRDPESTGIIFDVYAEDGYNTIVDLYSGTVIPVGYTGK